MKMVLILLVVVSYHPIANVSGLNSPPSEDIIVSVLIEEERYRGGEDVNISIIMENSGEESVDLDELQFQVLYAPLNFSVLNGEIAFRKTVHSGGVYSLSKTFSLPDYAPSGRYIINGQLAGTDGKTFGPSGDEMIVEANYTGIGKALGILLLYTVVVLALFALIFYFRTSKEGVE
jgi:hypothetical protein